MSLGHVRNENSIDEGHVELSSNFVGTSSGVSLDCVVQDEVYLESIHKEVSVHGVVESLFQLCGCASYQGQLCLLEYSSFPRDLDDVQDTHGCSYLHYQCSCQNEEEALKCLNQLQRSCNTDISNLLNKIDVHGYTPLYYVCKYDHVLFLEVLQPYITDSMKTSILISNRMISGNVMDTLVVYHTCVLYLCCQHDASKCATLLLQFQTYTEQDLVLYYPSSIPAYIDNVVHACARHISIQVYDKICLCYPALIFSVDRFARRSVDIQCQNGQFHILPFFPIEDLPSTPLLMEYHEYIDVELLTCFGKEYPMTSNILTHVLHGSTRKDIVLSSIGNIPQLHKILKNGLTVGTQSHLLIDATTTISYLLHNPNIHSTRDIPDEIGNTPVHYAVKYHKDLILHKQLQNKAKPDICNYQNQTPADMAKNIPMNTEMLSLLRHALEK